MILAWLGWTLIDGLLIPGLMRNYRGAQRSNGLAQVFA